MTPSLPVGSHPLKLQLVLKTPGRSLLLGSGFKVRSDSSGALAIIKASATTMAAPQQTYAADQGISDEPRTEIGEILVTARKRSESILETPMTVTALTGEDLAARGVVSVKEMVQYTPAVNLNNNAAGRQDRNAQLVLIRGFNPAPGFNQTASIFIDGVPVGSGAALNTIDNPARVEILKGPQSATFGRATFAGAVNIITREPAGDAAHGEVSVMHATRNGHDYRASLSAPILGENLTFLANVREFSTDGSWKNTASPGQTLGDQRTRSANLKIVAKPLDGLVLKAFGMVTRDKDGPSAQGIVSAFGLTDPTGKVLVANQSNCVLSGRSNGSPTESVAVARPFICGVVPGISALQPAQNTTVDSYITNFLALPNGRLVSPKDGVQGFGLVRDFQHYHFTADYDIGDTGLSLASLTGYNREMTSLFQDVLNYASTTLPNTALNISRGGRSYFNSPFLFETMNKDWSQEVRLSYDQKGPLRASLGGSYLDYSTQSNLGGGAGGLGVTTFSVVSGKRASKTTGIFGSLSYDVTPELTVDLEARYQIDKLLAYAQPTGFTATSSAFVPAGFYEGGSVLLKRTFKNFLPRAIARWEFVPGSIVYASYSKGVNPGTFNTAFLSQSVPVQNAAAAAGIQIGVAPEKVTNYEIGVKGRLLDGRLTGSISAFHADWTDAINSVYLVLPDPTTGQSVTVNGSLNAGKVRVRGVEADVQVIPVDNLTLNAGAALIDPEVQKYVSPSVSTLTGIFDFKGKTLPNVSRFSAVIGAQYGTEIAGMDNARWFIRGDYSYKSGIYADVSNVVRTKAVGQASFRAGVSKDGMSLETFVTNAFNNKNYTTISTGNLSAPTNSFLSASSTLVVGLPTLRTIGARIKYSF